MSIALPTTPGARSFHLDLLDWGGELRPGLGGAVQRINRIGMRYALKVELPPLLSRTNGRIWSSKLTLAKQAGAIYNIPSDGMVIGNPGAPLVSAATSGGIVVPIKGMTPGYVVQEHQWISFYAFGRWFLHAMQAGTVDGSGNFVANLLTPLRVPLALNNTTEISVPKIEGFLSDPVGWDTMLEPYNSIGFTIGEAV